MKTCWLDKIFNYLTLVETSFFVVLRKSEDYLGCKMTIFLGSVVWCHEKTVKCLEWQLFVKCTFKSNNYQSLSITINNQQLINRNTINPPHPPNPPHLALRLACVLYFYLVTFWHLLPRLSLSDGIAHELWSVNSMTHGHRVHWTQNRPK